MIRLTLSKEKEIILMYCWSTMLVSKTYIGQEGLSLTNYGRSLTAYQGKTWVYPWQLPPWVSGGIDLDPIKPDNYFSFWRRYSMTVCDYRLPSGQNQKIDELQKIFTALTTYNKKINDVFETGQPVATDTLFEPLESLLGDLMAVGVAGCQSLEALLRVGVYELKQALLDLNLAMFLRRKDVVVEGNYYILPHFCFSKVFDTVHVSAGRNGDLTHVAVCFVDEIEWDVTPENGIPCQKFAEFEGGMVYVCPSMCTRRAQQHATNLQLALERGQIPVEATNIPGFYNTLIEVLRSSGNSHDVISDFGAEIMRQLPEQYQEAHIVQILLHELGHREFAIKHGADWDRLFNDLHLLEEACLICEDKRYDDTHPIDLVNWSLFALPECYAFLRESADGHTNLRIEGMISRYFNPDLPRGADQPVTKYYERAFLLMMKLIGFSINSVLDKSQISRLSLACGFKPTNLEEIGLIYPLLDDDLRRKIASLALVEFNNLPFVSRAMLEIFRRYPALLG
ncbi:MAG: hypothetical protein N2654_02970 [Deltaproteobacteria bacterium]|nr:hypothetical protein [Deltaproteobacteria bacterium]